MITSNDFLLDATDFTDLPVLANPVDTYPHMAGYSLCPKCHGHGRWNLLLNQYGPGKHFQGGCGQCWGWGWVKDAGATCLHDYVAVAPDQPFRCWHTIECKKCGTRKSYSSDD